MSSSSSSSSSSSNKFHIDIPTIPILSWLTEYTNLHSSSSSTSNSVWVWWQHNANTLEKTKTFISPSTLALDCEYEWKEEQTTSDEQTFRYLYVSCLLYLGLCQHPDSMSKACTHVHIGCMKQIDCQNVWSLHHQTGFMLEQLLEFVLEQILKGDKNYGLLKKETLEGLETYAQLGSTGAYEEQKTLWLQRGGFVALLAKTFAEVVGHDLYADSYIWNLLKLQQLRYWIQALVIENLCHMDDMYLQTIHEDPTFEIRPATSASLSPLWIQTHLYICELYLLGIDASIKILEESNVSKSNILAKPFNFTIARKVEELKQKDLLKNMIRVFSKTQNAMFLRAQSYQVVLSKMLARYSCIVGDLRGVKICDRQGQKMLSMLECFDKLLQRKKGYLVKGSPDTVQRKKRNYLLQQGIRGASIEDIETASKYISIFSTSQDAEEEHEVEEKGEEALPPMNNKSLASLIDESIQVNKQKYSIVPVGHVEQFWLQHICFSMLELNKTSITSIQLRNIQSDKSTKHFR